MLLTAAFCLGRSSTALAHDPGLSSLELRVHASRIAATLALSRVEASTSIQDDSSVLEAIELRIDGVRLRGAIESRSTSDDGGTSVRLTFDRPPGSRLTVRSLIPTRLPTGHRELLTIRGANDQVLANRMLEASAHEAAVELALAGGRHHIAGEFFVLGVRHILGGYDHLLFLGALLLGLQQLRDVAKAVTAFTVAHSITLAMAACGLARAPGAIVEPLIALSIVWVGVENLIHENVSARWRLTFAFGLVHGFGFAGALEELGLGTRGTGVAASLGAFNAGVEVVQIAVAMLLWPVCRALNARAVLRTRLKPIGSIFVVGAGAYWFAERTLF